MYRITVGSGYAESSLFCHGYHSVPKPFNPNYVNASLTKRAPTRPGAENQTVRHNAVYYCYHDHTNHIESQTILECLCYPDNTDSATLSSI